jgi:hypothetical protein
MKALTILLACASILLSIGVQGNLAGNMHAVDYENIINYVAKVEKGGFNQKDFDEFALERKVMRKNVYLVPVAVRFALSCSTALAVISLGLVAFTWPRKRKEPTAVSGGGAR